MCGITGILRLDGAPVDRDELTRMTAAIAHRGPDGAGLHLDGPVGFGHRRLSIIDVEGGAQPISNETRDVWVTYNGEIYNYRELRAELQGYGHRFETNSDTEVLVHAYEQWGDAFVKRLRGMFAFAIWDGRRRRLLLARDRLGIKPLHYMQTPGRIAFASEMQAFRQLDGYAPSIDLSALDLYLHLQYIPAPFSIHKEIRKLEPAHLLIVDEHGVHEPERYWTLEFRPDRRPAEAEWIERLDAALRDAVRVHLVSDVDFGAFLSGGVDSSAVVAYMSQLLDRPVRTFTVGFTDGEYDEREPAREAAQTLGTDHSETVVQLDAVGVLPRLVEHYGEPFADSSAVCTYFVAEAAREQVKMVLSGDGGDEVFAGYNYFANLARRHASPPTAGARVRRTLLDAARAAGVRPRIPTLRDSWYDRSPYFGEARRLELWRPEHRHLVGGARQWNNEQFAGVSRLDVLSQCQYVDIMNYLPYDNLTKVDVATMYHGLEVRVPLLDHHLVELAAQIPPELRLRLDPGSAGAWSSNLDTGKYLLKRAAGQYFRPGFFDRTKRGFSMPVPAWLAGPFHVELEARLLDPGARLGEFFDVGYIRSMVREHVANQSHGWRLWSLLFLAEWMQQNATITAAC